MSASGSDRPVHRREPALDARRAAPYHPPMRVVRTYLQLDRPPVPAPPPALAPLAVERLHRPTAAAYRRLYAEVGGPYRWHDRDAWSDDRLQAHLDAPGVTVTVLRDGDEAAGYYELAHRPPAASADGRAEVELLYFGLRDRWLGRGLGRRLLEAAIADAWRTDAERLVLNTCTLDHAAALPNYLARGFRITGEETYEVPDDG